MRIGLIGAGIAVGLGVTLGSAMTFVDAKAGPGTARDSIRYGVTQTAGMAGEAANVLPATVEAVRPALTRTMGQAGDVLGGAATSVPPARTDLVDPADQTGGTP